MLFRSEHAIAMVEFAIGIHSKLKEFNKIHKTTIQMRIGINTGPLVAGILGTQKFAYDIWGPAVVVAARMESSGFPGRIQISETTYSKVKDRGFQFQSRGKVQVKGRDDIEGFLFEQETAEAMKHKVVRKLQKETSTFSVSLSELDKQAPSASESSTALSTVETPHS